MLELIGMSKEVSMSAVASEMKRVRAKDADFLKLWRITREFRGMEMRDRESKNRAIGRSGDVVPPLLNRAILAAIEDYVHRCADFFPG